MSEYYLKQACHAMVAASSLNHPAPHRIGGAPFFRPPGWAKNVPGLVDRWQEMLVGGHGAIWFPADVGQRIVAKLKGWSRAGIGGLFKKSPGGDLIAFVPDAKPYVEPLIVSHRDGRPVDGRDPHERRLVLPRGRA